MDKRTLWQLLPSTVLLKWSAEFLLHISRICLLGPKKENNNNKKPPPHTKPQAHQPHVHHAVYLRSTKTAKLCLQEGREVCSKNCFVADVSMEKVSNGECSLLPCLSVAISAGLLGVAFLLGFCVCFTYCFPLPFGQEPFYDQAR